MTPTIEQALALLFRKFRSPVVPENDLVKAMSLQLNWTKPSQAAFLLARGVQVGLLEHTEAGYRPRFDPNAVEVPFGFKPPSELFVETTPSEPSGEHEPGPAPATGQDGSGDDAAAGPPPAVDTEAEPDYADRPVLEAILDDIARAMGEGRREAAAAVNAKQQALDDALTLDACALLVAADLGLKVDDYAKQVLGALQVSG